MQFYLCDDIMLHNLAFVCLISFPGPRIYIPSHRQYLLIKRSGTALSITYLVEKQNNVFKACLKIPEINH